MLETLTWGAMSRSPGLPPEGERAGAVGTAKLSPLPRGKCQKVTRALVSGHPPDVQGADPTGPQKVLERSPPLPWHRQFSLIYFSATHHFETFFFFFLYHSLYIRLNTRIILPQTSYKGIGKVSGGLPRDPDTPLLCYLHLQGLNQAGETGY